MILKEKQLTNSQNPKARAGEEAERQMAFYLKRAFAKKNDCFVLNDIRIVHNDNVAQVDHLLITPYGLFIIESKSVHGKITINKQKEWSRTFNNVPQGMQSPVLQGEEQGKVLKELLSANDEQLLSKMLGTIQKGFGYCPINIYIAISDNGVIDRKTTIPELFKADQISSAIEEKLKALKKAGSLFSLSLNTGWSMSANEAKTVARYLLSQHRPLLKNNLDTQEKSSTFNKIKNNESITASKPEIPFVPKVGAICPKCSQHKLVRKSVSRSDGTETDFLACSGYPKECKAIFALVAVARTIHKPDDEVTNTQEHKEHDSCPRCKSGKLMIKINKVKKTKFIGCSEFPKCRFTS